MTYDLVIRGGNVADGRGGPMYEADIAVTDGKDAAVGTVGGPGGEEGGPAGWRRLLKKYPHGPIPVSLPPERG